MAVSRRAFIMTVAICLWLRAASSFAVMIPDLGFDIPVERIQGILSAGLNHEFGNIISYDIGFTKAAGYSVSMNLQLTGFDPGPSVRQLWETDTERIWTTSDRFAKPIVFDLRFSNQNPNHIVTVSPGAGRGDVNNWFAGWPAGTGSPAPWAHEVGHFLGNYDEYPGGGVNPNGSFMNVPDSIMGTGTTVYDRHYSFVADWAASHSAPEPASVMLVALGMITLLPLLPYIKRRLLR
jgi:hypothetical protein